MQFRGLGASLIRHRKSSGISVISTVHMLHCLEKGDLLHMDCLPVVLSLRGVFRVHIAVSSLVLL